MKTQQRKRTPVATAVVVPEEVVNNNPSTVIFSSDLLTPEEERELLKQFWEFKSDLVTLMIRHFPRLRAHRPPLESEIFSDLRLTAFAHSNILFLVRSREGAI